MYVKFSVTEPFACVLTVAAAWQSAHSAPPPVSVVRCGPCEFVTSVALRRAVALRAAVRPADRRAPGVPQHRRRALPVVVTEVDPAGTQCGQRILVAGVPAVREAGEGHAAVEVRAARREVVGRVTARAIDRTAGGRRAGGQMRLVRPRGQRGLGEEVAAVAESRGGPGSRWAPCTTRPR